MDTRKRVEIARYRSDVIRRIRRFFEKKGYLEVDTPALSPFLIPEGTIEVFETRFLHPFIKESPLYLAPSPELWMKRLLAEGFGNIFQICKAFRNAEQIGSMHNPEFTMLEWYTVESGYMDSADLTEELFREIVETGSPEDISPPFRRMSMAEAFHQFTGMDLAACTGPDGVERLSREAHRLGLEPAADDNWEEAFHRIFLSAVEPRLPMDRPLLLYDYPDAVATLARRKHGTPWNERWELYIRGIETANCFGEETDPGRVESFFETEAVCKAGMMVPHAIDRDFPSIFHGNFPRSSGVALGVDRLITALLGGNEMQGVILFPFSDIVSS